MNLKHLSRHYTALRLRRKGLKWREVGEVLGISAEGARQLSGKAARIEARPLNRRIDVLELSTRAQNCLRYAKVVTLGDLAGHTETSLLSIPGMGRVSLDEIKDRMREAGIQLAGGYTCIDCGGNHPCPRLSTVVL